MSWAKTGLVSVMLWRHQCGVKTLRIMFASPDRIPDSTSFAPWYAWISEVCLRFDSKPSKQNRDKGCHQRDSFRMGKWLQSQRVFWKTQCKHGIKAYRTSSSLLESLELELSFKGNEVVWRGLVEVRRLRAASSCVFCIILFGLCSASGFFPFWLPH